MFKQWESGEVNMLASILVKNQPHYHHMSIPKRFNEITVKFSSVDTMCDVCKMYFLGLVQLKVIS